MGIEFLVSTILFDACVCGLGHNLAKRWRHGADSEKGGILLFLCGSGLFPEEICIAYFLFKLASISDH